MITKDLKISVLLREYPDSLNVLLKVSPHFQKLRNKLLRKALAGRVTVEQAATIAGVDLESLLLELNKLAGYKTGNLVPEIKTEESANEINVEKEKPAYLKLLSGDTITTLDVRPILNSGKDPLNEILNEVKKIKIGGVLLIINSFEPVPLYTLLAKKGFSHWAEHKDDCWNVYFYNRKEKQQAEINSQIPPGTIDIKNFENIIELDVHDLPAPEPMIKILENLGSVDEKSVMLVYHHREPLLLYSKLEERGYEAVCNKIADEKYQILIAKKRDS